MVSILRGQDGSAAARNGTWTTKAIELKYLDPEDLRRVFSSQSYVMQVNRDLKLLIVTGPQNFVKEVRESGATVIWIGPPDSSRFSAAKQENIYSLIRGVSSVALINSRPPITSYERGKTGPDGIHYNRESSATWARKVIAQLDATLAKEPRRSH